MTIISIYCNGAKFTSLKNIEGISASLNKDQIITVVNDILPRAQACIESDRGAFE